MAAGLKTGRDHAPMINGNEIVFEMLCYNIPIHLIPKRVLVGIYSEQGEREINEAVQKLYSQIVSAEVELIDRETWKSM